jgi:hypothetical protein
MRLTTLTWQRAVGLGVDGNGPHLVPHHRGDLKGGDGLLQRLLKGVDVAGEPAGDGWVGAGKWGSGGGGGRGFGW